MLLLAVQEAAIDFTPLEGKCKVRHATGTSVELCTAVVRRLRVVERTSVTCVFTGIYSLERSAQRQLRGRRPSPYIRLALLSIKASNSVLVIYHRGRMTSAKGRASGLTPLDST